MDSPILRSSELEKALLVVGEFTHVSVDQAFLCPSGTCFLRSFESGKIGTRSLAGILRRAWAAGSGRCSHTGHVVPLLLPAVGSLVVFW